MIFTVQRAISWSPPLESWWRLDADLLFVFKKYPKIGKGRICFNLMLLRDGKVCHLNKRKFLNIHMWAHMPLIKLTLLVLSAAGTFP